MADVDPALLQKFLRISERQREPDYNITATRMMSGPVLKCRNGLRFVIQTG